VVNSTDLTLAPGAPNPLAVSKVFSQLPANDLAKVVGLSKHLCLQVNQLVYAAGATPTDVIVLVDGALYVVDALEDGRLCHVGTLQPGDSAGWIGAIDGQPTSTHIVAAAPNTRVLLVPIPVVKALFLQRPSFSGAALSLMASTIRHYMRTRAALTAPTVAQRIYRALLGIAEDAPPNIAVVLPKQQDLAVLANTTRETVSRTLQELIKRDILDKRGHQVTVKNLDALRQLASATKPH
jgi:CRP/FNR family transcriptional regulator, cyclic AMP receptor protein